VTPEIRSILERAFGYARGADKRRGEPSDAERHAAAAAGYPIDEQERLTHDENIARLHAVRDRLAAGEITAAFVAGVGGSAPRGLQPLISYAFARHLPVHLATGTQSFCEVCSIERDAEVVRSKELLRCHLGFLWNEGPTDWVLDLEELADLGPPRPTDADRATFAALLAAIAEAPADCTPGQLEKELARRKVLPHSRDKYQRYGMLEALGEVGVLPNPLVTPRWDRFTPNAERHAASAKLRGSPRSDIVLPFGGWRGALGVDWKRTEELFGTRRSATQRKAAATPRKAASKREQDRRDGTGRKTPTRKVAATPRKRR